MSIRVTEDDPIVVGLVELLTKFNPIEATRKDIKDLRKKLTELKNKKFPKAKK